ncbi:MAG: pH regulation protein F [Thermococci archaeon]|nr:pH regulation protein F [Thermococci archaeon]
MGLESQFMTFMKVVIPIYLAAFVVYMLSVLRGRSVPDVVLAVDCMSFDVAAFMAILAVYFRSTFLVTGAIVLALWAYLLDVYVAKHLAEGEVGA